MRRGQIALFVVIGLVLVMLLLLFLFRARIFGGNEIIPAEQQRVAPVTSLVVGCVESSLEQLIREAGGNGGYLDTSHLRRAGLSWDSEIIDFSPQQVPYWSHLKRCSESSVGCEASEQPPLCKDEGICPVRVSLPENNPSIQEQLEAALPGEVEKCLDNFRSLSEEYDVQRKGEAKATVMFTNSAVLGTLEMPVVITDKNTGQSVTLRDFNAKADVNLVRIYRLAHDIAQAERGTSFLERLTLHLIAIYSGIDAPLPPMRTVTLLGAKQYWSRTQVERLLQEEILPYVDFIQVPNALGSFVPIWPSQSESVGLSEEEQRMYAGIFYYLYVKVNNETYPDVKTRFFYPGTKPYVSINGGQELLKPRSADIGGLLQKMVGVFINDYRFSYDVTYPVIVTLTDESAFGGKGLDWSFGLEANIRKNAPVNRSASANNFLIANERVDFTAPQQRVRNSIVIHASDKLTGEPLPFTRISYRCGDEFFVGETNESGSLVTRLPYCRFGGVILYSKEGYLGSGFEYDNFEEEAVKQFIFALWPIKNVTIFVQKRTPENIAALEGTSYTYESVRENSHGLNDSDLVILNIERVKETPYDEDMPLTGFFTLSSKRQVYTDDVEAKRAELENLKAQGLLTDQDVQDWLDAINSSIGMNLSQEQSSVTVQLAPGAYSIDAFLLYNKEFTIPAETREFCKGIPVGGSCLGGKERFTLNATNFTTWLSGGAAMNASEPFELTDNILYRFDTYTFYVLEQPLPKSWADMENYQTPEDFLEGKRLIQLPTYG